MEKERNELRLNSDRLESKVQILFKETLLFTQNDHADVI